MYSELRRLTGNQSEDSTAPLCYRWHDCLLDGSDDRLRLIRDGKIVLEVEKQQFLRHPGRYFRLLRNAESGMLL